MRIRTIQQTSLTYWTYLKLIQWLGNLHSFQGPVEFLQKVTKSKSLHLTEILYKPYLWITRQWNNKKSLYYEIKKNFWKWVKEDIVEIKNIYKWVTQTPYLETCRNTAKSIIHILLFRIWINSKRKLKNLYPYFRNNDFNLSVHLRKLHRKWKKLKGKKKINKKKVERRK